MRDPPPAGEAVAVPMMPGDALIFNVSCVHGSGPNTTSLPRWAIQMQYRLRTIYTMPQVHTYYLHTCSLHVRCTEQVRSEPLSCHSLP